MLYASVTGSQPEPGNTSLFFRILRGFICGMLTLILHSFEANMSDAHCIG